MTAAGPDQARGPEGPKKGEAEKGPTIWRGGGNYNESKTGFSFLDATLIVCGGLSRRGPQAEALARVPGLEVGVGDWQSAPDLAAGAKEGMAGLGAGG